MPARRCGHSRRGARPGAAARVLPHHPAEVLRCRPPPCARVVRARRRQSVKVARGGRSVTSAIRQPPTPDPRSLPRSPHPPWTGRELLAVDRPGTGRCPAPLGGRGECGSELTTAGHSARSTSVTTVAGSSPRGLTTSGWDSPRRSPCGGEWAGLPPAAAGFGPAVRRLLALAAPRWSVRPAPGVRRGVHRGVHRRVHRGLRRRVHRGVRSPWAVSLVSPGQALVSVWCVVRLPLPLPLALVVGEGTGGSGGSHRNRRGAALARARPRRPVAAAPRRAAAGRSAAPQGPGAPSRAPWGCRAHLGPVRTSSRFSKSRGGRVTKGVT